MSSRSLVECLTICPVNAKERSAQYEVPSSLGVDIIIQMVSFFLFSNLKQIMKSRDEGEAYQLKWQRSRYLCHNLCKSAGNEAEKHKFTSMEVK